MNQLPREPPPTLQWRERLHYRDQLRAARYSALADAEGFGEICFAIESLGLRLLGLKADLKSYENGIRELSTDALYDSVRVARNDAMHTGVSARHATSSAIELCIGLEEALMKEQQIPRTTVSDFMVKAPVAVEPWQPVAHARQLILMHSFSFLPVYMGGWKLVSEVSMAKYLNNGSSKMKLLASTIEAASEAGLEFTNANTVASTELVSDLLAAVNVGNGPTLWLVVDQENRLSGVLSPFELM